METPELEPKEEQQIILKVGLRVLFGVLAVLFLVFALLAPNSKWWEWPLVICMILFCVFMVLDRW